MKNTNYIINGVLAVAVIVLFILQFSKGKNTDGNTSDAVTDSTYTRLPIAYIRTDSLLSNYNYYKDLSEMALSKIENQRASLNLRGQQLQKEIIEFQQKAQINAFLSDDRRQQEQIRLSRKQQELEEAAGRAEQELAREQAKMQMQLSDTIVNAIKIFNESKKYQVIFSNVGTDNFYFIEDAYDITREVIDFLNARYAPQKK